jgi:hypothetical protein
MCGIFGVLSTAGLTGAVDRRKFLKDMFGTMDHLRGTDSSGIIAVDAKGVPLIHKNAIPGRFFMETKTPAKVIYDIEKFPFFTAHVRAATKGSVTTANAHPFSHDGIHLVHNGTLYSHSYLPDGNKFDVDSEAICHSISKIGAEETLEKLSGAFALAWYDESNHTMNFCRNDERPLWFSMDKDGKSIYFGSELWLVEGLMMRNGIGYNKEFRCWDLDPGEIHTYNLKDKVFTPEKKKVKLKEKSTGYYVMGGRGGYHWQDGDYGTGSHGRSVQGGGFVSEEQKRQKEREENTKRLVEIFDLKKGQYIGYNVVNFSSYGPSAAQPGKPLRGCMQSEILSLSGKDSILIESTGTDINRYNKLRGNYVVGEISYMHTRATKHGEIEFVITVKDEHEFDKDNLNHISCKDIYKGSPRKKALMGESSPVLIPPLKNLTMVTGPNGMKIPELDFRRLVKNGCLGCGEEILVSEADEIGWITDSQDDNKLSPLCCACNTVRIMDFQAFDNRFITN